MNKDNFYDGMSKREQKTINNIYDIKNRNNELNSTDKEFNLNLIAFQYLTQKMAFENVLIKESFELVDEVSQDYTGKIAFLTQNGTFSILGKLNGVYRSIFMTRIHTQEYSCNGELCRVLDDFSLNKHPQIKVKQGKAYYFSKAIGLARTESDFKNNLDTFTKINLNITDTISNLTRFPNKVKKRFNIDDYVIDQ